MHRICFYKKQVGCVENFQRLVHKRCNFLKTGTEEGMGLIIAPQWEKLIMVYCQSMYKFLLQRNNQKKWTMHYGFGFGKKRQTPSVDPQWEKKSRGLVSKACQKYVFVNFMFE